MLASLLLNLLGLIPCLEPMCGIIITGLNAFCLLTTAMLKKNARWPLLHTFSMWFLKSINIVKLQQDLQSFNPEIQWLVKYSLNFVKWPLSPGQLEEYHDQFYQKKNKANEKHILFSW